MTPEDRDGMFKTDENGNEASVDDIMNKHFDRDLGSIETDHEIGNEYECFENNAPKD